VAISNTFFATCALSAAMLLSPMAEAAKENYDRSKRHFNVAVNIGGEDFGAVEGLSGLGLSLAESDDPKARPHYSNITLKRGYTGSSALQNLVTKAVESGGACQDCSRDIKVTVLGRSGEVVRTFHLIDTFPVSWSLSSESKGRGDIVSEEVSFSYSRIVTN